MTISGSNFRSQKKAELHAHLNGCVPTHVVQQLLEKFNVTIPEGYDPARDLQVTKPVAGLAEYFKPWHLLKLLPIGQACLNRMTSSALAVLREDGIDYVELRNSPFSIATVNGISLEECLNWMTDSLALAREESGVDARLILGLSRLDCNPTQARKLLDAIRTVNNRELVVGLDLSGDEDNPIDSSLSRYFREGKDEMGLGVSIHAGETFLAANVDWAIHECNADRIGHALAAAAEPRLLDLLATKQVCVEVCLYSNFLTGKVTTIENHPVRNFIDSRVPFVLCADNPSVHNMPLSEEYALFALHFPDNDVFGTMYETQLKHSFGKRLRSDDKV
ncbi:MAG: hypothetical protein JWQ87_3942 [Candidatus Sulfotelmatobacter sp.]|nr:hypothetical protein [Candidatus Sulfotelmatobacter sp.]